MSEVVTNNIVRLYSDGVLGVGGGRLEIGKRKRGEEGGRRHRREMTDRKQGLMIGRRQIYKIEETKGG